MQVRQDAFCLIRELKTMQEMLWLDQLSEAFCDFPARAVRRVADAGAIA